MSTTVAPTQKAAEPEIGVHESVPFPVYASWDLCSSTRLGHPARTPAHLRAYLHGELDTETAPKNTGRAVHCAVLEPDDFPTRYMVAEPCMASIASGRRKGEPCGAPGRTLAEGDVWLCGMHDRDAVPVTTEREPLDRGDYDLCMAIRDALLYVGDQRRSAWAARRLRCARAQHRLGPGRRPLQGSHRYRG